MGAKHDDVKICQINNSFRRTENSSLSKRKKTGRSEKDVK